LVILPSHPGQPPRNCVDLRLTEGIRSPSTAFLFQRDKTDFWSKYFSSWLLPERATALIQFHFSCSFGITWSYDGQTWCHWRTSSGIPSHETFYG
jgi:hypothetical protein